MFPGKVPVAFSLVCPESHKLITVVMGMQNFHSSELVHAAFNEVSGVVSPTLTALSKNVEGMVHQRKIEGHFLGAEKMLDR